MCGGPFLLSAELLFNVLEHDSDSADRKKGVDVNLAATPLRFFVTT